MKLVKSTEGNGPWFLHFSEDCFIHSINDWSQFWGKYNWYTFTLIEISAENEVMTGGFEFLFKILGLGFRFRLNYNEKVSEMVTQVKAEIAANSNDYELLEKAPQDHLSDEFIDFLRDNNKVVFENGLFLIIENCKYHKLESPWYTVFFKCRHFPNCHCAEGALQFLDEEYGDWEWRKKATSKQTVKRYHIHLIRR